MRVSKGYVRKGHNGEPPACFVYTFRASRERIFGRQWEDAPRVGELLHWRDHRKQFRRFFCIPYHHGLFRQAVRYFVDTEGKRDIYALVFQKEKKTSPVMQRVDLRKIPRKR